MSYRTLLRQTGRIEEATIARSAAGDQVPTWATWEGQAAVPCHVRPAGTPLSLRLGEQEQATHKVHVPYDADLAAAVATRTRRLRIVVDGAPYEIVDAYDPGQRHHHLELATRRL